MKKVILSILVMFSSVASAEYKTLELTDEQIIGIFEDFEEVSAIFNTTGKLDALGYTRFGITNEITQLNIEIGYADASCEESIVDDPNNYKAKCYIQLGHIGLSNVSVTVVDGEPMFEANFSDMEKIKADSVDVTGIQYQN